MIDQLALSKITSTEIGVRVADSKITEKEIDETREGYRPVAFRASLLFFCILDLCTIDPMYQYSLEFFSRLFNRRLDKSEKSSELDKRLEILIKDVTESFFTNICRGLFERDKLLYAFLNASSIKRRAGDISVDEWTFFRRGSATDFSQTENTVDYISQELFMTLLGLEECHVNFAGIVESFKDRAA